ncbi:MAG: methyltransferase domain-containing protein [Candidatus Altiarchaeota archaeon]|nr:methyltransferase domain-containing protein [Candidatus Altiarchaeota archaeon]
MPAAKTKRKPGGGIKKPGRISKPRRQLGMGRFYTAGTFKSWSEGKIAKTAKVSTASVVSPQYRVKMANLITGLVGPKATICSVGPGSGHVEKLLVGKGHKVVGIERFFPPLPELKRQGIMAAQGGGERLPLGSKSVDMVYMDGVLGHMVPFKMKGGYEQYYRFMVDGGKKTGSPLVEARRVLKDKGFIVIAADAPRNKRRRVESHNKVEYTRLDTALIGKALKEIGFVDIKVKGIRFYRPEIGRYTSRRVVIGRRA